MARSLAEVEADLDRLHRLRASGVERVATGDRSVQYAGDLDARIASCERERTQLAQRRSTTRFYLAPDRAWG